jgi:hypothetical protein
MNDDVALTGNFGALPSIDFTEASGRYSGLLLDEAEINFITSGFLSLRVTGTGRFRGAAIIGGVRQPVAGQFDRFGYAPLVSRRGTLSGSLQIESGTPRIRGILTDERKTPALLLYREQPFGESAPIAGAHHLVLSASESVPSEGEATAIVMPDGRVRLRGVLGDGTRFVERTFVASDLRVPVFVLRYQNRGGLIGWLGFTEGGTLEGVLRWMRPGDSRSPNFPDGFAVETLVTGARAE